MIPSDPQMKCLSIERTCERCGARLYHSAILRVGKRHIVDIRCKACGHEWRARYKKDEWN